MESKAPSVTSQETHVRGNFGNASGRNLKRAFDTPTTSPSKRSKRVQYGYPDAAPNLDRVAAVADYHILSPVPDQHEDNGQNSVFEFDIPIESTPRRTPNHGTPESGTPGRRSSFSPKPHVNFSPRCDERMLLYRFFRQSQKPSKVDKEALSSLLLRKPVKEITKWFGKARQQLKKHGWEWMEGNYSCQSSRCQTEGCGNCSFSAVHSRGLRYIRKSIVAKRTTFMWYHK